MSSLGGSMERRSTEVTIFGHKFTLSGTTDPEAMRNLAAALDARMKELARPKPGEPIHRVAIYTALVLQDELGRAQAALDEERRRFDAASRNAAHLDLKLHALLNESRPVETTGASLGLEEHSVEPELEGLEGAGSQSETKEG